MTALGTLVAADEDSRIARRPGVAPGVTVPQDVQVVLRRASEREFLAMCGP